MPKRNPNKPKLLGKPPKFKDPQEILKLGKQFFEICKLEEKPFTITGLALSLGFNSRTSLLNYEGKPGFVNVIKELKSQVERFHEERLSGTCPSGSIFWLKNCDWSDRQESSVKVEGLEDMLRFISSKKAKG